MIIKDDDLIARARKGDHLAFEEMVIRYQKRVYNLAYRMLGDREDANDLAQEVFVKVYTSLQSFKGECSLSTWIMRIAVNKCLDQKRARARHPLSVSLDKPLQFEDQEEAYFQVNAGSPDPSDTLVTNEMLAAVEEAILKLPVDFRVILILRDMQGYAYEELAEILHISMGTVKSRLSRARQLLKEELMKKGELFATHDVSISKRRGVR